MELKGFSNYLIYEDGRVWSKCKGGMWRKDSITDRGYHQVCLQDDNKKRCSWRVHRLVAMCYNIPNPENKPYIDHIDRNTHNNHVSNLRWSTCSENQLNQGLAKNNKSGVKGVSYSYNPKIYGRNSWRADWREEGVRKTKRFPTKEEAIEHRKKMTDIHYSTGFYIEN